MARRNAIKLGLDMANVGIVRGSAQTITVGESKDYVTIVDFTLDCDPNDVRLGLFKVEYNNEQVEVNLRLIENAQNDPIMQHSKEISFGVSGTGGIPSLPFEAYTDNRGFYPAVSVRIVFPYRLANWSNPEHETGINMEYDPDAIALMGPPDNKDKITALTVFNRLMKKEKLIKDKTSLSYDDVTVFNLIYFKKGKPEALLLRSDALVSKRAYRDAVEDYFLEGINYSEVHDSVKELLASKKLSSEKITSEAELLSVVEQVLDEILKHHIENRRWVDAFWDGDRVVEVDGKKKTVPRQPKNETRIQTTLHVILDVVLEPLGIQVIRESDEGIGSIDFRCLFTNAEGKPLSVAIEFKLAHHKQIRKGIKNQLPAYLKAIKSNSGIFFVLWFKDSKEKFFKQPENDIEAFTEWLGTEASTTSQKTGHKIVSRVIDASIKPSASK